MRRRGVHPDDMYDHDPTLAAFARDLQDAAAATPSPAVGASLAAVLDGRAPTAVYPEVVSPVPVAPGRRPLRLRWALAASAAFGIGAGSLGVAGALPGPVQRQVSRMAEVVGVDLPDGRDGRDSGPPPVVPAKPTIPPSTVVVPPRPSVVPPEDRPVPSTIPDDPSNRGNREGRGRGDDEKRSTAPQSPAVDADDVDDDLDDERSGPSDAEDELGDRSGEGDGSDTDRDEDRSGPGDGEDDDEDDGESELEKLDGRRNPSMVTGVHAKD